MKLLAVLLGASVALASIQAQDGAPAAPKRSLLKYTPPKSTAGGARIDGDGGSRGPDVQLPAITVLAPKEAAVTISEQPSLFWFQAGPMPEKVIKTARIEVALIDPKNPKPLFKVTSPLAADKQAGAGLRRLSVGKQNVTLKPGVTYKWSVALVPDPANRSQDVVTSASIQRIEPSKELAEALKSAADGDKAAVFAQNGVWYDAVDAITTEIGKDPNNAELRKMRGELLRQGGLKDAAAADLK
ncbi:MAG: DUF928 domain-containing protein [Chthoniobacteraceae bacterium]